MAIAVCGTGLGQMARYGCGDRLRPAAPEKGAARTMGVLANNPKVYDLVASSVQVEKIATGFTFTEGPVWHPDGYLLFSDMPMDIRRKWTEDGGVVEVMNPANKCNGMTLDAEPESDRLRALDEPRRPRDAQRGRNRGEPRGHRLALRGQGAELPERRRRQVRRLHLLLRPDLRADGGIRAAPRAGHGLPGRLPDSRGRR